MKLLFNVVGCIENNFRSQCGKDKLSRGSSLGRTDWGEFSTGVCDEVTRGRCVALPSRRNDSPHK